MKRMFIYHTFDHIPVCEDEGRKKEDQLPLRRIIVRFSLRAHFDQVWSHAKTSQVLKQKNIKILDDLTQQVKDARA